MTACRRMRNAIVAVVRRQASEADRLRLEQHLTVCGACRAEKARWLLLEHLQEQEPQCLSSDARARILGHLTNLPEPDVVEVGRARRLFPLLWGTGAAAAVAIALLVFLPGLRDGAMGRAGSDRTDGIRPSETSVSEDRAITIRAHSAGAIDSGGAHIVYGALATFRVQPGGRQVDLLAGEIDIEVAPGGAGRFRVLAPRFTVEVLGTHFVVGLDRVETQRGLVRVVEPDAAGGRLLALVRAGQTWHLYDAHESAELNPSDPHRSPPGTALVAQPSRDFPAVGSGHSSPADHFRGVESVASGESPAAAEVAAVGAQVPAFRHLVEGAERGAGRDGELGGGMIAAAQPSAKKLLADARAALARGDTRRARECVAGALKAAPQSRHRAIAQLLLADTLLVESRYPAALAAYRRTMDVFGGYPEGETAAFALAQLLSERGPEKQARDALERYLARYPRGRFAEEVEKKLANSPAP